MFFSIKLIGKFLFVLSFAFTISGCSTLTNNSNSAGQITINSSSTVGGNSEEGISGVVRIFDPMKQSGTTDIVTMAQAHMSMIQASAGHLNNVSVTGANAVTTAVNNIKFQFSSGNIESGKVSLYGRKVS